MTTNAPITSSDQAHQLYHTFYDPESTVKATLLIVHGMADHSGRYQRFAQFLADNGIAVATYDQLGHGRTIKSREELGFFALQHPVQSLLKDVIIMADRLKSRHPNVPHFVFGHSMGSFIVRTVMKHHAQDFAGAILMGSADSSLISKVMLPLNSVLAKAAPKKPNLLFADVMNELLNRKLGRKITTSKFAWLSENPKNIKNYEADPLTGFAFTNNGFLTLFALMLAGLNKNWAATIRKDFPMLFVSGENDPVGNMGRDINRVVKRLQKQGFNHIDKRLFPNMRHEPLHEQHFEVVYHDILKWLMMIINEK